jgi:hypothetical protein
MELAEYTFRLLFFAWWIWTDGRTHLGNEMRFLEHNILSPTASDWESMFPRTLSYMDTLIHIDIHYMSWLLSSLV